MADSGEDRVQLEDNDNGSAPTENTTEQASEATSTAQKSSGGIASAPRSFGDNAGSKMESVLSPVGKPLGKGLGAVGGPVGGLVEPLVGGVMKTGSAFGGVTGVGAGNMEHKNREEDEERKKPYGEQEQTGENPLGL